MNEEVAESTSLSDIIGVKSNLGRPDETITAVVDNLPNVMNTENMGSLLNTLVNSSIPSNHINNARSRTPSPNRHSSPSEHERDSHHSSNQSSNDEHRSNKRKFEPDASSSEAEGGKKKKCYRCGGFGHIQPECTSAQSAVEAPEAFVCYKCSGKGHFARNCPNLKKDVCYLCGTYGHHSLDCPTSHMRGPKGFGFSSPSNFLNKLSMVGQMPNFGNTVAAAGFLNAANYAAPQTNYGSYDPYGLANSGLSQQGAYDNSMQSSMAAMRTAYGSALGMANTSGYSTPNTLEGGGGASMRAGGCYRCGEQGHIAKSCPFGGSDQPYKDSFSCYRCGQSGHLARACANDPVVEQKPTELCFRCGEYGHFIRDCNRNGAVANKQACFKCGQLGHQSRYCVGPDVRVCFYCKQTGHVAKDCKQQPRSS